MARSSLCFALSAVAFTELAFSARVDDDVTLQTSVEDDAKKLLNDALEEADFSDLSKSVSMEDKMGTAASTNVAPAGLAELDSASDLTANSAASPTAEARSSVDAEIMAKVAEKMGKQEASTPDLKGLDTPVDLKGLAADIPKLDALPKLDAKLDALPKLDSLPKLDTLPKLDSKLDSLGKLDSLSSSLGGSEVDLGAALGKGLLDAVAAPGELPSVGAGGLNLNTMDSLNALNNLKGFEDKTGEALVTSAPDQQAVEAAVEIPTALTADIMSEAPSGAAADLDSKVSSIMDSLKAVAPGGSMTSRGKLPCADVGAFCADWAKNGECTKNARYMEDQCKESCGLCSGSIDSDCSVPISASILESSAASSPQADQAFPDLRAIGAKKAEGAFATAYQDFNSAVNKVEAATGYGHKAAPAAAPAVPLSALSKEDPAAQGTASAEATATASGTTVAPQGSAADAAGTTAAAASDAASNEVDKAIQQACDAEQKVLEQATTGAPASASGSAQATGSTAEATGSGSGSGSATATAATQ